MGRGTQSRECDRDQQDLNNRLNPTHMSGPRVETVPQKALEVHITASSFGALIQTDSFSLWHYRTTDKL